MRVYGPATKSHQRGIALLIVLAFVVILLGLVVTTDAIEGELQELFAYRTEKFRELLKS